MTYYTKGYFIGLAENDLLTELKRRDIDYVLVMLYDAVFQFSVLQPIFRREPWVRARPHGKPQSAQ